MIPTKRGGPPRRPPTKHPMSSAKQVQYLTQQHPQMARMMQQQAWERRTQVVRAMVLFALMSLVVGYAYHAYGVLVSLMLLIGGWLMGWLELLQIILGWLVRTAGQPSFDELLRRADIMSQPIRTKETVSGENEFLEYGSSSMQGWRRSMEDAHTLLLLEKGGFFGVYDGHSGAATAKYCGEYMFQFVHQTKAFVKGEYSQALYDGFIAIDKYLHTLPSFERGGCAAVVLYVDGDDLYCANAGDSRCVLCRNGNVENLSTDHKPYLTAEQMRIERAGCFVLNRRVNGMLALSRAIGDFMFKTNNQVPWEMQAVTSAPEVRVMKLNRDKDEFAVLACDGIWDMMTSKQVVDFVRPRIQKRVPLGTICEELMEACLSPQPFGLGCDNMSVVIIKFKRGPQGGASAAPSAASGSPPSMSLPPHPGGAPASDEGNGAADGATASAGTAGAIGGDGESAPAARVSLVNALPLEGCNGASSPASSPPTRSPASSPRVMSVAPNAPLTRPPGTSALRVSPLPSGGGSNSEGSASPTGVAPFLGSNHPKSLSPAASPNQPSSPR